MLHIYPEQPCTECNRHTMYALMQADLKNRLLVDPRCYEHGYADPLTLPGQHPTPQQAMDEYSSIARFVVYSHDGRGTALVIGPCSLADVPNYEPLEVFMDMQSYSALHVEEKAWHVRYKDEDDEILPCWVVWSYDSTVFTLYK